ncbi:MAG: transcriptional regulator [Myxococcales bacterium]
MRIAHVSDLHVLDLTGVSWRRFMNKRVSGAVNLLSFRRGAHPAQLLVALVDHLIAKGYDHVVITGDLSNLALDAEFARARRELERLGGPERVTVIPGNHDTYTAGSVRERRFQGWFGDWMGTEAAEGFPFVKQVGGVTFLGLNSTYWTLPFLSYGRVGRAQRELLVERARDPRLDGTFKVVLLHHNLHRRGRFSEATSRLRDRDAVARAIADAGANLVLHGHSHKAHRYHLGDTGGRIPVIGCGSSTWHHRVHMARYNVYDIGDGALRAIHSHQFDVDSGAFRDEPVPLAVP